MNFLKGHFTRGAFLCLLGVGIFLIPMSVRGSSEARHQHATKLAPSFNTEPGNNGSNSAEISFKPSDEFCAGIKSDLETYKMLSGKLDEAQKELENRSKRDKKEIEEEIDAIRKSSKEILPRISEYFKTLKEVGRPNIAKEDLANYDETLANLEKFKKEHEKEIEAAEKEKAIQKQIEEESRSTKISTEKAKDLKDKIKKAKDEIRSQITTANPSSQLKAELEDTIRRLEKHEEDLNRMIESQNSISEEPYTAYQPPTKPSGTEPTPKPSGETKTADNKAKQNSGNSIEKSSSGSGSSSSTISPGSASTQSRGSVGEHSTEEINGSQPELPKSVANTVAQNRKKIEIAKSFGAQTGDNSTPTPGNAGSPSLNPTGAGAVANPSSNIAAPTTGQPMSATRSASVAGISNYNIEVKQGTSPPETSTNSTVGEQSIGSDPLGLRPFAVDKSKSEATDSKLSKESRRANVAYNNPSVTGTTGPTNISIQPTSETPASNNGPQAETKKNYAFDNKGNLIEAPANTNNREVASTESEPNSKPIDEIAGLKKLYAETSDAPAELEAIQNIETNLVANATKTEPTLSAIDKFIAGLHSDSGSQSANNTDLQSGRGLLSEVFKLGNNTGGGKSERTVSTTNPKTNSILAGTKASSAEQPSLVRQITDFFKWFWN